MEKTVKRLSTTALVIGTGGGGLSTAIELAEMGVDVLAVSKRNRRDAHTVQAAGGINAALATMDKEDTWQQHAADTIKEGYFLSNPLTVEKVTKNAAKGIEALERYGMRFAREGDGRISQRYFGAHKYRRTSFFGDYTGLEIQRVLVNRAEALNIQIIDTMYITRILVKNGRAFGAYGFDVNTGIRYVIYADAIILAAAGHTRIWKNSSSRKDENTGDTFRLAIDAGCRIRDAELVQFHPSGITSPPEHAGHLITEAARGETGKLLNGKGERYMEKYDPERMELSTRDRISLASYTEIKEGRGTENGGVLLDLTHLSREHIMERLPRVYQDMIELQQLDISKEPIEIAPTAHYTMGGVWVDPDTHRTEVEGLWATGEASSGLHGANRLGGNSLIELLVYGPIVGKEVAEYAAKLENHARCTKALEEAEKEIETILATKGDENVRMLQRELRELMTVHCGVVRDEAGLKKGLEELSKMEKRAENLGVYPDIATFAPLAHAFDLKANLLSARATLECALERRETRGCHNRSDYPEMDKELNVNLVWSPKTGVVREAIPAIPEEIAKLIQ